MRRRCPNWRDVLLLLSACVLCGHAAGEPVALVADRVIDGVGNAARVDTVVVIDGDRIAAVGDRSIIPAGAKLIELPGQTLMPGFINCHEHPLMYADDYQNAHLQASSAYKALMGLAALQRQLLAGWTTVRVMGDASSGEDSSDRGHSSFFQFFSRIHLVIYPSNSCR